MENDKARLRRYEDDVYVSGVGIMVMGVWTVIKTCLEIFLGSSVEFSLETDDPRIRVAVIVVITVIIAVLMLLVMKLHFYIGRNAVRAAKGMKYKKGYLKAAKVMLVLTILGMGAYFNTTSEPGSTDTTLASILVDLTTVYIFVILIRSAGKLNKLKQQMQEMP